MRKSTTVCDSLPVGESVEAIGESELLQFRENFNAASPLDGLVLEGARRMLQQAVEFEVEEFLARHADRRDDEGRRQVVRNGHLPEREILTGAGPVPVEQPRVRDNSPDKADRVRFSPSVLPSYLKRSTAIEELIPWLYLKGISTGDFTEALQSIVGERARVSAPTLWSG